MMYVGKESSDERVSHGTVMTVADKCRKRWIHKNMMAPNWGIMFSSGAQVTTGYKKSKREVNM